LDVRIMPPPLLKEILPNICHAKDACNVYILKREEDAIDRVII
jgi:hypothetical protein